jgi:starch phosphorylase
VIIGEPYHSFVPGYRTGTVNLLRLWRARASQAFDFELFDRGDYARAVSDQVKSESVSKVLYPNDNSDQGKELRLKQQYFFVACSLRDIIRRFHLRNSDWSDFPDKVSIQLNDTHPVIAIPELMRILIDEEKLTWHKAWEICRKTFAYTNHTLMPEALETWSASLFNRLLPRHLEIIGEINRRFLDEVRIASPDDRGKLERMAIIANEYGRQVNMAHLATVGSMAVNGVAEIQSGLLKERLLSDFAAMYPEKFQNKTNGVTPRRFIALANPSLSQLINETIGEGWLNDLEALQGLEAYVDDEAFVQAWQEIKTTNKAKLASVIHAKLGLAVSSHSMFDVMVKRLHEYKRQLLKVFHIITLYQRLKAQPELDITPRTFVFGAKAAPGYRRAKLIIKLINSVADVVNTDVDSRDTLKVAFIPNFNVSVAEQIYPAANLSEQISMAGKEASGTGNMKFALNGALTVGTLDGANIEIRERVGAENFFLFGLTTEEVFDLKGKGYQPRDYYQHDEELRKVIDSIARGDFSGGDHQLFAPLVNDLLNNDEYLHLADYRAYVDIQDEIDIAFHDTVSWTKKSILNTARCGFFSSDRTIQQYADEIWQAKPVPVAH